MAQEIRVGVVTTSISRLAGGLHNSVRELTSHLESIEGVRQAVFAIEDSESSQDIGAWGSLPLHLFPVLGPRIFAYSPRLHKEIALFKPDITHLHGIWTYPSIAVMRWARQYKRPFVVSPHGMIDKWALRNSRYKKRAAWIAYAASTFREAACIRVLNEAEYEAARSLGLRNPVCVIPNGVNLPLRTSEPDVSNPGPKVRELLYLGRLHPKKNVHSLIAAFGLLIKRKPGTNWRLVIAGWGDTAYVRKLKQLAEQSSIAHLVDFPGTVYGATKDQALSRATAFILPSLSEGLPVAILEAWAYSKPVLATPECNLKVGFDCAAAIEIGTTPEEILVGLEKLDNLSMQQLNSMGRRGVALVREAYQWETVAAQMFAVYQWLLGRGAPPACMRMGQ